MLGSLKELVWINSHYTLCVQLKELKRFCLQICSILLVLAEPSRVRFPIPRRSLVESAQLKLTDLNDDRNFKMRQESQPTVIERYPNAPLFFTWTEWSTSTLDVKQKKGGYENEMSLKNKLLTRSTATKVLRVEWAATSVSMEKGSDVDSCSSTVSLTTSTDRLTRMKRLIEAMTTVCCIWFVKFRAWLKTWPECEEKDNETVENQRENRSEPKQIEVWYIHLSRSEVYRKDARRYGDKRSLRLGVLLVTAVR